MVNIQTMTFTDIMSLEELVFFASIFTVAVYLLYRLFTKSRFLDIKISTFNALVFLFELGTILFLTFEIIMLDRLEHLLANHNEDRYQMFMTADKLRHSSDDLTHFARSYAVTGKTEFKDHYYKTLAIRNGLAPRPKYYNEVYWDLNESTRMLRHPDENKSSLKSLFASLPFTNEEVAKLTLSESNSNRLVKLEMEAFEAMEKGNQKRAINLLHSKDYYDAKHTIMLPIDEMMEMLRIRIENEIEWLHREITYQFDILLAAGFMFIIGNIIIFTLIRRKVNIPIEYLTDVIQKYHVGKSDLLEQSYYNDEIGYMIKQFFEMQRTLQQTNEKVAEQKTFLDTVFNSQHQMIITLDSDNTLMYANNSFYKYFSVDSIAAFYATYKVDTICDLFIQIDEEESLAAMNCEHIVEMNPGKLYTIKMKIPHDNTIFSVSVTELPMKEKLNLVVFTDVTEIKMANQKIGELNKRTQESLNYAALIQGALVPKPEIFRKHFEDYFILWHPRDLVGGDIYLMEELHDENEILLLVVDCTGHGVPGAFVTMLVKAIERQLVGTIRKTNESVSPAYLLGIFNRSIKHLLQQNSKNSISNAGFDGGVFYYNKKENLIRYAGANTPLFYTKNGEVMILPGDKHSIGHKTSESDMVFTDYEIIVDSSVNIYLSTDGYMDQNGGTKSFPFGKKRFVKLIEEYNMESMADQQEIFLDELTMYQGDEPRNDDITVVAFNIHPYKG